MLLAMLRRIFHFTIPDADRARLARADATVAHSRWERERLQVRLAALEARVEAITLGARDDHS